MTIVNLVSEAGVDFQVEADLQIGDMPSRMTRSEREDWCDGCEIWLFSIKSGRRLKALEWSLSDREWANVRNQMGRD